MDRILGGYRDEARKNVKHKHTEEQHEEGRMRRVPDIMSVCM